MSGFLAAAAINASSGRTDFLFISSLMKWLSYLSAHKLSEGKLMDGKPVVSQMEDENTEKMTPSNRTEQLGSLAGAVDLITGMGVVVVGVQRLSIPVTFAGAVLFNTEYIVAHISTTGEPL
jgi:hypothetical protein